MSDFWPKGMNPRGIDPELKEVIRIHEQMRQMTERIRILEGKQK